jgi:nitrate reductase gamma subunit
MDTAQRFLFGIYPYICLAVFLLGSLIRFDREQYTWKTDSSQLLRRGQLRIGNILFHAGILMLFFGHLFGLLTPKEFYHALGLSTEAKQALAMTAGGIAGAMCLVGMLVLLHRRFTETRLMRNTRKRDVFIQLWILATLLLGLISIGFSFQHMDGSVMVKLAHWAQYIVTFRAGAADFILDVPPIYCIHLFFGMTLFLLFPFTRLVHAWSGFAAVGYVGRAYQLVRGR